MTQISRSYWFSAAHRLFGHPKCGRLHGHNYLLRVVVTAPDLVDGMVIDFAELDKLVKPAVDMLDHRYIQSEDIREALLVEALPDDDVTGPIVPHSTAEEIAQWFWDQLSINLGNESIELVEVHLWETHKSQTTIRS